MLKSKKIIIGYLLVFAVFTSAQAVGTEATTEQIDLPDSNQLLRGTPAKREGILPTGQRVEIITDSYRSKDFLSKYVVKFKVESENKESILLEELYVHGYGWTYTPQRFFIQMKKKQSI